MLFTKIMQTSGKRACSCLPECLLFPQRYIKILSYHALPFFFVYAIIRIDRSFVFICILFHMYLYMCYACKRIVIHTAWWKT